MIKFRPLFLYDPAMEQAWLEDQAKRGWFVYEYKSLYASFWQEDPREVRFRLEPAGASWFGGAGGVVFCFGRFDGIFTCL